MVQTDRDTAGGCKEAYPDILVSLLNVMQVEASDYLIAADLVNSSMAGKQELWNIVQAPMCVYAEDV